MPLDTFFIDLDDTVYSPSHGIWDLIGLRMNAFIQEYLGIEPDRVSDLRESLWHQYGTTLRGLQARYQVEPQLFLSYVHDIPIEDLLTPNPALRAMLLRYPQRKVIFTNADQRHALRVLNRLGIADCFDLIIDVLATLPHCKPNPEAFTQALRMVGNPNPADCVMMDDSPRNLASAAAIGMQTICVSELQLLDCPVQIPSLMHLPEVIPFDSGPDPRR